MHIMINGKEHDVLEHVSLGILLSQLSLSSSSVVVEHNRTIVPKHSLGNVLLKDGDTLEIVRLVGGG